MNVLLTGSSGFIGSYFQNHYKSTYNISTFSFQNDNLNALDLTDTDTIIHLSALVHQMGGASKEAYWKINVDNTLELAQKAKEKGLKHFIFMSSVKVYGEETNTPYNEKTKCEPQDDYGRSKLEAENKLLELEDDGFIVSILRTPIVYGYGVKANIKNLIGLVNKVPLLPFAHIENTRSMVYIGNLCYLIDTINKQQKSGIFLASDDAPLSTSNLIKVIAKELNKNIYLLRIPFFETFLKVVKPSFHKRLYESLEINNDMTKKILNYQNPYHTKDGIRHMIHGEDK
jgi:UDP-glucose 4-epimerase